MAMKAFSSQAGIDQALDNAYREYTSEWERRQLGRAAAVTRALVEHKIEFVWRF